MDYWDNYVLQLKPTDTIPWTPAVTLYDIHSGILFVSYGLSRNQVCDFMIQSGILQHVELSHQYIILKFCYNWGFMTQWKRKMTKDHTEHAYLELLTVGKRKNDSDSYVDLMVIVWLFTFIPVFCVHLQLHGFTQPSRNQMYNSGGARCDREHSVIYPDEHQNMACSKSLVTNCSYLRISHLPTSVCVFEQSSPWQDTQVWVTENQTNK